MTLTPECRMVEVIGLIEVPTRINQGKGAMAQYIVVEVSSGSFDSRQCLICCVQASRLVRKPASVPFDQASGLPTVGMTAHQGLFEHGNLQAHQRVMINGGSSSVGAVAIQLAKDQGATVVTSCSGPKMEMVKGFGADEVCHVTSLRMT
jgi:NADPH:quinone reductase-like Zn-dependent oxidoreductase